MPNNCKQCMGKGEVWRKDHGPPWDIKLIPCPSCEGRGCDDHNEDPPREDN